MGKRQREKAVFLIRLFKGNVPKKAISSDLYSAVMPEPLFSIVDSARETTFIGLIFSFTLSFFPNFFIPFLCIWSLFSGVQRSYKGWKLLKRLHQIIESEKWEIEHHRKQERKELEIIYKSKGFGGKLLQDVVDILMADNNRLLQVMLEEEMGIELESYEHPLKQGLGGFIGAIIGSTILVISSYISPIGIFLGAFFLLLSYSIISSRYEHRGFIFVFIWNIAIAIFIAFCAYFFTLFIKIA